MAARSAPPSSPPPLAICAKLLRFPSVKLLKRLLLSVCPLFLHPPRLLPSLLAREELEFPSFLPSRCHNSVICLLGSLPSSFLSSRLGHLANGRRTNWLEMAAISTNSRAQIVTASSSRDSDCTLADGRSRSYRNFLHFPSAKPNSLATDHFI